MWACGVRCRLLSEIVVLTDMRSISWRRNLGAMSECRGRRHCSPKGSCMASQGISRSRFWKFATLALTKVGHDIMLPEIEKRYDDHSMKRRHRDEPGQGVNTNRRRYSPGPID